MKNLCTTTFPANTQCSGAAQMYEMGVTMFGGSGFIGLQDDFCECIEVASVVERYSNILRRIYLEHSGKGEAAIGEIISAQVSKFGLKAGVKQLGALFYRVLKKYDSAIRHVDARVGRDPPKPKQKPKPALGIGEL